MAASSQGNTNPNKQVTCPICLEHYSDPRLLPCLHTYCRKCLEDLLAKGKRKESVVCPECGEEVQITSGDVTKLKVNFWINNLLSLLAIHSTEDKDGGKAGLTCENCDSKAAATGRCVNCCMFLCNVCFTAHQRLLALKDHQLMTLDELKHTGIPVMEKQLFCTKHKGEVMKLFCDTCQELICRDCTIIDHRDHEFSFIEDVANQHKESFKTEITRASNTKNKVETVLKSVQEMKEKVQKTSKATEKDVDDFIDQQIRALEEKRAELKKETRRIAAKKMKKLATQENSLVSHVTGLKSAIEFTEQVLKNGGKSDVLSISKEVTSCLSQLCERQFHEKPCQQDGIELKFEIQIFNDRIDNHVKAVDICLPDPKQCLVTQSINGRFVQNQGPITATQDQVLKFVVCVCDAFGEKLESMQDRIQVKVEENPWTKRVAITKSRHRSRLSDQEQPEMSNATTQLLDVQCHDDNTYSFDYCMNYGIAEAEINVTVDGIKVQGCPFQIVRSGNQFGSAVTIGSTKQGFAGF